MRQDAYPQLSHVKDAIIYEIDRTGRSLGIALPRPRIAFSRSSPHIYDCLISRNWLGYRIDFLGADPANLSNLHRTANFLHFLASCPRAVRSVFANISDGNFQSAAPFAMAARHPDVIPLPDNYFFNTRGFIAFRKQAEDKPVAWDARSPILRWRGGASGDYRIDPIGPGSKEDSQVLPRIRMALILKGHPGCDIGFAGSLIPEGVRLILREAGLESDFIPEENWINDKFALDIDGHTNTWSNFLVRMHLGCCVIKVDSQHGYRQWYYDRIRPWEHFVPVKADMSDLVEKIEWARSHDAEAKTIAANGQAFARSMTFESETRWAVAAICSANGVSSG
ncbi:glycosyl transferase family 90 [Mesorhizobium sp. KR9-304]|uniref:glycosyl transferase family 90 n=1 Tax=Mesorhizobium sp. KR9-304 TaxID=3156614 RepID=UPI0032B6150B